MFPGKEYRPRLFMGTARNILRAETRFNNQPGRLLTTANQYIYEDSEHGMFVTVFYMLIDPHNNLLYYGNAGHNDQLLIKAKTKQVEKLNADGKALGINIDSRYEEKAAVYEKGDTLVLFTDGVLEYLGNGDIEKGEKVLIQKAIDNLDNHPSEFTGIYKSELEKIDLDDEVIDDFTILSIKF